MKSVVRTRQFAVVATIGAMALTAVALAGPAQAGLFGSRKPKAEPPPAAAAYTPPPVGLPNRVIEAAAVYEAYIDKAAAITADFTDGASVSERVRAGAAYEAQQLQRGEAAYAAVAALQDPAFVTGVKIYAADPASRVQIAGEIMKDPAYVLGLKGADSAAALAANVLNAQGVRVKSAGEKVKQAAYDVQKLAWSKAAVVDRDGRLAEAKSLSLSPRSASPELTSQLRQAASGQGGMPRMGGTSLSGPAPETVSPATLTPASLTTTTAMAAPTLSPPYTPLVVRGLAAAALAVLGEGSEANSDNIWAVLEEPNQGLCLNMAKLNLYQCLSVAKPYYEDVFCLGQHILMDTGQCVIVGAGVQTIAPHVFSERASAVAYGASRAAPAKKKSGSKKVVARR